MLKGNLIKIAIIDDDEDDYFIITEYIKGIEGGRFAIDWCNTYEDAVKKFKEKAYHLYFIDYRLGGFTGLELLQEAQRIGNEAPIVILTGKGNKSIDIAVMQNGATDYLVKSELNTEKLERCIRYSLDRADSLKKLKERETRYRNLFTGSKDAVFIADEELNFTEVNHATSLLFGCKTQELIESNLFDFIKRNEHKDAISKCIERRQRITDMEIEIISRDKEVRPCLFSVSFQQTVEEKWLIHGIIHDITVLKRAEAANLQAQKLEANERLMRIIAHEIRNPLNNIGLSVQHFASLNDTAEQKELINIIQRNCDRINNSITELLNMTKTGELIFKRHTLQEIMNESIAAVADRINLQNIKVEKKYYELPLEISADRPRLKIAFSNILINAIEAMEKNKGKLGVFMSASPESVTVSIKDNGMGISEESMSRLFEPFFTLKENGIGLGLATSYAILQSHNANIQVESKLHEGTNFIISFNKSN